MGILGMSMMMGMSIIIKRVMVVMGCVRAGE